MVNKKKFNDSLWLPSHYKLAVKKSTKSKKKSSKKTNIQNKKAMTAHEQFLKSLDVTLGKQYMTNPAGIIIPSSYMSFDGHPGAGKKKFGSMTWPESELEDEGHDTIEKMVKDKSKFEYKISFPSAPKKPSESKEVTAKKYKALMEKIAKIIEENDSKGDLHTSLSEIGALIEEIPEDEKVKEELKTNLEEKILKPRISINGNRVLYDFGEAGYEKIDEVGGKGAGLTEMVRLGMPVPEGFTISSRMGGRAYNEIKNDVLQAMARIEDKSGKKFGDAKNPLLVSVRSGAKVSMPGMMESILNVGVNEEIANQSEFFMRCYEKLLLAFGRHVLGIEQFGKDSSWYKSVSKCDLKARIAYFKTQMDYSFPQNPERQLELAIRAVFNSWNSKKAKAFREAEGISDDGGTAVNIQRMVFGNRGGKSLSAVVFTRNPITGKKETFGTYIENAQGEDVVGGAEGKPISKLKRPRLMKFFQRVGRELESKFGDMQDMEITVEDNKPYLLQTRGGKRTTRAAIRIALDLVEEGKMSEKDALLKIKAGELVALKGKQIAPETKYKVIGKGTAVSPGIVQGRIAYNIDHVKSIKDADTVPILFRRRLESEDIKAINLSKGIITLEGGNNEGSHPIVVARSKNIPVITGVQMKEIDGSWYLNEKRLTPGNYVTVNADTGELIDGTPKIVDGDNAEEFERILKVARKYAQGKFILLSSNPKDVHSFAKGAGALYAPGIGMTLDEMKVLKEAILGDKEALKTLELQFNRQYVDAMEKIGESSPLVISLLSQKYMERMVPDEKRLRFREQMLEQIISEKEEAFKELVTAPEIGKFVNYFGKEVKVICTCAKNILGCSGTSGKVKAVYSNGDSLCVDLSKNPNQTLINFTTELESVRNELGKIKNVNPGVVYEMQREAVKRGLVNSGVKVTDVRDYSEGKSIEVNGANYEVVTLDEFAPRILEIAQEAIVNGK